MSELVAKSQDTKPGEVDESVPVPVASHRTPQPGDVLVTLASDGRMRSRDEIVREVQDYLCSLAPAGRLLSEELIAERRREFEAEEAEFRASPPLDPRP